jgi:hypothetical protein
VRWSVVRWTEPDRTGVDGWMEDLCGDPVASGSMERTRLDQSWLKNVVGKIMRGIWWPVDQTRPTSDCERLDGEEKQSSMTNGPMIDAMSVICHCHIIDDVDRFPHRQYCPTVPK